MSKLKYVKHTRVSLKGHPEFDEKWLQEKIAEDPGILELPGQPELLDRERIQEKAGRLDLLLYDQDADRRFELELMLGTLNESHIIRAIEYWDIERRRYPGYEHVAVIVAEDVTGRFLNILGLFAGTIPMIVLQCEALQVGDQLVLDFVKVIDQTSLRRDDEEESNPSPASRDYWVDRVGEPMIGICDKALSILNAKASSQIELNYLRQYIGIRFDNKSRNYVFFGPKKKFVRINVSVDDAETWLDKLSAAGLEAQPKPKGGLRVAVTPGEFQKHENQLRELLEQAVEEYEGNS